MNKKWLALALVLVVTVVIWTMRTDPGESADTSASGNLPSEIDSADPVAGAASDTYGAADRSNSAEISPFALTDDEESEPADVGPEAIGNDSEAVSNQSADAPAGSITDDPASARDDGIGSPATRSSTDSDAGNESTPDADDASPATGPVVEVPDSYPVTEASKYFVPKEERRPGNLGGPPPLDFPGGPSDPNLSPDASDADGLAPPPAPGQ